MLTVHWEKMVIKFKRFMTFVFSFYLSNRSVQQGSLWKMLSQLELVAVFLVPYLCILHFKLVRTYSQTFFFFLTFFLFLFFWTWEMAHLNWRLYQEKGPKKQPLELYRYLWLLVYNYCKGSWTSLLRSYPFFYFQIQRLLNMPKGANFDC